MTNKKIFCTDLDETLLTTDKKISPATKQTLRDLLDAGHYLILNSGRSKEGVLTIREELPLINENVFISSYNGAQIVEASTGQVLMEETLQMDDTSYFIDFCESEGIPVQSYDDGVVIAKSMTPELEKYLNTIKIDHRLVPDICKALTNPPLKCLALSLKGPELLDPLREKLLPWAGSRVTLVRSSEILLEAFSSRAGKDNALKFLADYLGVPIINTMAAGDQSNDIAMIKAAGTGVGMVNGVPEVREAADIITKEDNNHDGLVPLLREFFELP